MNENMAAGTNTANNVDRSFYSAASCGIGTGHPLGFKVVEEAEGQYALYEDPWGLYVLKVNVYRAPSKDYQRWIELPRYEKAIIELFPGRLDYLIKRLLRSEGVADSFSAASGRWTLARVCAVCTLFLIPISTAGVNILAPLMVLLTITCSRFWREIGTLCRNRPALAAVALFALLGISLLWDVAPLHESVDFLLKYRKLLYLPFLLILFKNATWRRIALMALCVSLTLVLILSCTNWLGLTGVGPLYAPDPIRASWVFKHHITQGIFTAFLAYVALTLATIGWNRNIAKPIRFPLTVRLLGLAIVCMALLNLFVMQQGRTGQVLMPAFLILWGWQTFLRGQRPSAWKVVLILGIIAAIGGAALLHVSYNKSSRLSKVGGEIHEYETSDEPTSTGLRLEFYRRSLLLISERPLLGAGVGSVGIQFQELASGQRGARAILSSNPHNEYLLMSVQLGIAGMVVFVWLLWQLWRESSRVPGLEGVLSGGYVVAFGIACMANSLLLDFPEGHMLIFLCGTLLASSSRVSPGGPLHMASDSTIGEVGIFDDR